jgi:hypothetical protein
MLMGIALIGLLTACGGEPTPFVLPTVAQLPTVNAAVSTPPTPAPLGTRQDLPPSWTPNPSETVTATSTFTPTLSVTPSATITDTPSPTPTDLPTVPPEERPRTSLIQDLAQELTGLPPSGFIATAPPLANATAATGDGTTITVLSTSVSHSSTTTCPYFPAGGFGSIFNTNPDIAAQLGCPLGAPPDVLSVPSAVQPFQNGLMIWLNGNIYVLNSGGTFRQSIDTFQTGTDPETTSETPPAGLVAPIRGFLKLWTTNQDVRAALGWGLQPEQGAQATVQQFSRGMMVWLPTRADILVFISTDNLLSGTWRSFAGKF